MDVMVPFPATNIVAGKPEEGDRDLASPLKLLTFCVPGAEEWLHRHRRERLRTARKTLMQKLVGRLPGKMRVNKIWMLEGYLLEAEAKANSSYYPARGL